jgi:hypothetical protein
MMRSTFALLFALAASVAFASDPDSTPSMSGTPKPSTKKPATPAPKPSGKFPANIEQIRALDIAKVKFMSAIGACPRPENCDPKSPDRNPDLITMISSAEEGFMVACAQCTTDAACEQERDRIKAGRGRMGYNVCAPPKNTATPGDKKPASDGKAPATAPAPSK